MIDLIYLTGLKSPPVRLSLFAIILFARRERRLFHFPKSTKLNIGNITGSLVLHFFRNTERLAIAISQAFVDWTISCCWQTTFPLTKSAASEAGANYVSAATLRGDRRFGMIWISDCCVTLNALKSSKDACG